MFKWVSLARIGGKGGDKKERGAFSSATLPLPVKLENLGNSVELKTIEGQTAGSSLNGGNFQRENKKYASHCAGLNAEEPNFEDEECVLCSTPNSGIKCLQARKKIHREERLRAGADRLLGIIKDTKVRIKILGELNSINSRLQLLREQHFQLLPSSDVVVAANDSVKVTSKKCHRLPMLSPELKELKTTDCFEPLRHLLRSHFYEDPESFAQEFKALNLLRKKCSNARFDEKGLETFHEYYNQLFFIDRRFVLRNDKSDDDDADNDHHDGDYDDEYGDHHHHHRVLFEWYDAFTGMKSCQSSTSFERGCLLFNMGVLYAKLAIRQRLLNFPRGRGRDYFLRASGAFRHLRENFNNAPSCDIQWSCSEMLTELMMLQQQEVLVEDNISMSLEGETQDFKTSIKMAQHASYLSNGYSEISLKLSQLTSVPRYWSDFVDCKHEYYEALCHYIVAFLCLGILRSIEEEKNQEGTTGKVKDASIMDHVAVLDSVYASKVFASEEGLTTMVVVHLQSSISCIESALRTSKNHIKLQFAVQHTFRHLFQISALKLIEIKNKKEIKVPTLQGPQSTNVLSLAPRCDLKPIPPEFSRHKVEDLFKRLGCLSVFSIHNHWTRPRTIELDRRNDQELGFSVSGEFPPVVASVQASSPAYDTSMRVGDFITSINGIDVKWTPHGDVIGMIKSSSHVLSVTLVTPTGKNRTENSNVSADMKSSGSDATLHAEDFSRDSHVPLRRTDSETGSNSTNTSRKSLVTSLVFDNQWKSSKILSVLKSDSLCRTFQVAKSKRSSPSKREEVVNTDNVVIVERN